MRQLWCKLLLVAAPSLALAQQPYPPYPQQSQYPQQPPYQQQYPQQPPYSQAGQYPPAAASGQYPPTAQDQPGQPVARLSVINGEASVRRGDASDWMAAVPNAPLLAGDSIGIAPNGRAELQLDNANFVRIAGDSEVRLSELVPQRNQVQVAKGTIEWRVLRNTTIQSEISTPSVTVHPESQSAVRVEVDADGTTHVTVRHGEAEVSTARGSEHVAEGQTMMVRGAADDTEFQLVNAPARDAFDSWNEERDATLSRAQSPRYASPDIYGTEDLDQFGRWANDPAYGNVWMPNVAPGWSPYSDGEWMWEDYYGWTWIPAEPWGWAPFHYGNWYMRAGLGWAWYPGPRYGHYWWHPAMVGFFGFGGGAGLGVGFGFGNVGWVPLAPFEVFRPWYGPGWFGGGRFGVINNVNVNVYNSFRNARFVGGVNVVTANDFQRGIFTNRVPVNAGQLQRASLVRGAVPVTPTASNLRFSQRGASFTPATTAAGQRLLSRPVAGSFGAQRTPFVQQQAAMRSAFTANGAAREGAFSRPGGAAPTPNGASGWQRFGEPNAGRPGEAGSGFAPRSNGVPADRSWDRFGAPQQQRSAAPSEQQQRNFNGQSRSLQVAPPMVRERQSAPAPSYRAPSAPSFRSAPSMPRGGGGGGGNRGGGGGHGGHR